MDQDVLILTPEKTVLSRGMGSLSMRVGAFIIDCLAFVGISIAIGMGVSAWQLGGIVFILLWPVLFFLYFYICLAKFRGCTIGKKSFDLRVCMLDGTPITPWAALVRTLLLPADLFIGLGLLVAFLDTRGRRIGDMVAGTMVVRDRPENLVSTPPPHLLGRHPLEGVVGPLNQMTPEQYAALRALCDRFPNLPPATQERLLRDVWRPIAQSIGIPQLPHHDLLVAEAVVMKYGREHGLL